MKLYNIISILLSNSLVFSLTLNNKIKASGNNSPLLSSKETNTDLDKKSENNFVQVYEECNESLNIYNDCLKEVKGPFLKDVHNSCEIYRSEKCQNYYREGILIEPKCHNKLLKDYVKMKQFQIKVVTFDSEFPCIFDEEDNECPYVSLLRRNHSKDDGNNSKEYHEKLFYTIINETCYSKTCSDAYLAYMNGYAGKKEAENQYKLLLEKLNKTINTTNQNIIIKRSFSIENYIKEDPHNIINKTILYVQSDECKNKYTEHLKKSSNASLLLQSHPTHIIFLSLLSIVFVLL
ncbi:hypothetical protein PIROE2DRAFT_3490 [Piromyces sp. E2]|nr:hypothetical protein PIROE2DRAFT_3490 [Piromyces sp. E2]|eukprot:OUM68792.1 hypothetical protein PIROE2DRAFT_3490 [Piromyces sp. E2]